MPDLDTASGAALDNLARTFGVERGQSRNPGDYIDLDIRLNRGLEDDSTLRRRIIDSLRSYSGPSMVGPDRAGYGYIPPPEDPTRAYVIESPSDLRRIGGSALTHLAENLGLQRNTGTDEQIRAWVAARLFPRGTSHVRYTITVPVRLESIKTNITYREDEPPRSRMAMLDDWEDDYVEA